MAEYQSTDQASDLKNTVTKKVIDGENELDILRAAMEQVPVAISILCDQHSHYYHNICFEKMFGYTMEELKDRSMDILFTDTELIDEIKKFNTEGNSWEGEAKINGKYGQTVPVSLHVEAIKDKTGHVLAFLSTYTDITQQKQAEIELKRQNEYLSTFHSISLGMFRRLNLSELLNALIVRACRLTKIPNGFLHLYDPDKKILELKAACGNLANSVGYKVPLSKGLGGKIFTSGEPIIIENYQEWSGRLDDPLFDKIFSVVGIPLISGSKIEGIIGLSHHEKDATIDPDIISILEEFSSIAQIAIDNAKLFESQKQEIEKRIALEAERKEMESKLYQSQRMESIGTLAGGIAHDFNNILSSIMGFTQIGLTEVEDGSSLARDLNEIYMASVRAKDLIQQILTFARQSDEQASPLRVSLIAKEVLKFIRSSIPSTITIDQNIISSSSVLADPTQMYQVFLNLFTNASQAMEKEGGRLSVGIVDHTLEADSGTIKAGDYMKITISDTGIGIPEDCIHNIFEPYFTTKKIGEGTGLGLAVVHGTVKGLGGDILVQSTVGKGTTFTIYLPVTEGHSQETEAQYTEEVLPQGNQEHIMVVDDEEPITRIERRILERLGYRVSSYTNSFEALDAFYSDPESYSVILTDMTMPNLTGDRLIEKIWEKRSDIPVILCTGFSQFLSEKSLLEKGIEYYLRKPVLKAELAKIVRSALDGTPMDEG